MRQSDRLHRRIWWIVILILLFTTARPEWAPVLFVPVVGLGCAFSTLRWREKLARRPSNRWYARLFSTWGLCIALVVAQLLVALLPAGSLQNVLMLLPLILMSVHGLTS